MVIKRLASISSKQLASFASLAGHTTEILCSIAPESASDSLLLNAGNCRKSLPLMTNFKLTTASSDYALRDSDGPRHDAMNIASSCFAF